MLDMHVILNNRRKGKKTTWHDKFQQKQINLQNCNKKNINLFSNNPNTPKTYIAAALSISFILRALPIQYICAVRFTFEFDIPLHAICLTYCLFIHSEMSKNRIKWNKIKAKRQQQSKAPKSTEIYKIVDANLRSIIHTNKKIVNETGKRKRRVNRKNNLLKQYVYKSEIEWEGGWKKGVLFEWSA